MKPKLRNDAKASLTNIVTSAIEREHNFLYQCCLNCENFNEKLELCLLANKRPPVRVLTFGCEKWLDKDEIPF